MKILIALLSITVLSVSMTTSTSRANGIDLHQFYPAQNTRYTTVESPTLSPADEDLNYVPSLDHDFDRYYREYYQRLFLQVNADLLASPLVTLDPSGNRSGRLVDSLFTMDLSAGYQFSPRISLFGETSFSSIKIDSAAGANAGTSTVMGDSRILMKWLLTPPNDDSHSFTFAVIPELDIPTGNSTYFTSSGSFGYGLNLSAEQALGKLTITGNFGIRLAPNETFGPINYQKELPYSLGLLYRFNDTWGVTGEFTAGLAIDSNNYQNHAEVLVGPRWRESRDWTLLASIGTGHFKSDMSDDFRAVLQVKYTPFNKSPDQQQQQVACPVATPVPPPHIAEKFCPLENITFANDKIILTEKSKRQIREFAARLKDTKAFPRIKLVQIQGHASPVGPLPHNQVLSEERGMVSRDYLMELGIPGLQVETRAYSQFVKPRGDFKTHEALMDAWRRAEFFCDYDEVFPDTKLTKAKEKNKKPSASLSELQVDSSKKL